MEGRPIQITPQRVHLGMAAARVREILTAHATWPAPPLARLPVSLAAEPFTGDGEPAAERVHLVWHAAHRFLYRVLGGTFHGAWEEVTLRADGERTDVALAAGFLAREGSDHRRLRLQLEHAARTQLMQLGDLAERRSTRAQSVHQLLAAVTIQEETEWGHAGHGRGVERIAVALAEALLLPPRQIAYVQQAAQLHDLGKIALDGDLWARRGVLLASQRAALEPHASLGAQFAARAGLPDPVVTAIRHHHEQWDGRGYPERLAGESIPLKARVLFLAEVIDTMLRPSYRRAPLTPAQALTRLEAGAGRLWDPLLTRLVMRQLDAPHHPRATLLVPVDRLPERPPRPSS